MRTAAGVAALVVTAMLAATAHGRSAASDAIVFSADRLPSVTGEIYRLGLDGSVADVSRSPFADTGPVVSPDGRWIAFLSDRGHGTRVYVARPNGSAVKAISAALPGQGGQAELAWSPDGRRVAVASSDGSAGAVSVVGLDGSRRLLGRDSIAQQPAWSPDGRIVTALVSGGVQAWGANGGGRWFAPGSGRVGGWSAKNRFAAGVWNDAIAIVDERGRTVFRVHATRVAWSPDGSRLASAAAHKLEVRSPDGRVLFAKTIAGIDAAQGAVVFAGGGRVAVYTVDRGPLLVSLATGRVSRASQSVFFGTARSRSGVVASTVRRGSEFAIRVGSRDVGARVRGCWDDGGYQAGITALQFAPDGRSVVYQTNCYEPFANLYTVAADGTSLRRLTTQQQQQNEPATSPDGGALAYTVAAHVGLSCKGCPQTIVVAGADGRNARALTHTDSWDYGWDGRPAWSPDGRTILYSHSTIDSFGELFTVAAGGGTPVDLHVAGAAAAWGPARIAVVDGETLWTVAPDGGDRRKEASGFIFSPAWSRDGRLAWLRQTGEGAPYRLEIGAGPGVLLPFTAVRSLAWSPDGTRLAVAARAKGAATFDVFTLAPDGTGVRRITRDVDAYAVAWG